ncbi:two-component system regulatory protein YycI [Lactobacillus sp. ESL0677]|uniref:two-component system regulatory protein YycI n=1 Tax=Lactobacillus sp. ESL0677 TaxID=2983208 RepID=UPI0023F90A1B|nr:two-component system regulatory protein YycI [Lactobacillus sp. ESL0677]WEV37066.1 two-component system regulatory protein YycI [Lactobacillus sp. ESL0677]
MDRKRIEWLFFVVFLLIDLYLGIEIWRSPINLSNTGGAQSTSIRSEMRADGIDLPLHISHKQRSGYYLAAKKRNYLSGKLSSLTEVNTHFSKSDNILTGTPKTQVTLSGNHHQILAQLNSFKNDSENVPFGAKFKYEPSMSGSNTYCYVQSTDYGQVYASDAQLMINVRNNAITNYTISYMGPISAVREPQLIISAWHAVKAMYTDREIVNNSRVMQIKLGYSKLTEVRGSIILLPTWLIWVENKTTKNITVKRVNAFTAQILQSGNSYSVQKN